jgi:broad specificity phosphatase PhoE
MTARLTLICHGSTDAVRAAAFPMDEPLDHYGETGATELAGRLPNVDFCWTSPELRTRQTAEALELNASVQPMLRECDYGRWAGRAFGEIVAHEPDAANFRGCTIPRLHRTAAKPSLASYVVSRPGSLTSKRAANDPSPSPIQQ